MKCFQRKTKNSIFIFVFSSTIFVPFFTFDLNAAKIPILYMTWSSMSALEKKIHIF